MLSAWADVGGKITGKAIRLTICESVRKLPDKRRIYYQKANYSYAMFINNKQVKGSVRHVTEKGGGHIGRGRETWRCAMFRVSCCKL